MRRLLICFCLLFLLISCDKGSNLIIEEKGFPEIAEIYLLNNLDPGFIYPENLQYMSSREVNSSVCIDISEELYSQYGAGAAPMQSAGAKNTAVTLDKPLKTHTCYSTLGRGLSIGGAGGVSPDQGFDISKINEGVFSLPFYNICMEMDKAVHRSNLILRECNQSLNQKFVFESDGKIKPMIDLDLCLTVSTNYNWYGGGYNPIFIVRDLFLSVCNPSFNKRQRWGLRPSS